MANIFEEIQAYYDLRTDTDIILPQRRAEQYFRKKAWQGATPGELSFSWDLVKEALEFAYEYDLDSFSEFLVSSMQEIFYRVFDAHPELSRTEATVQGLIDRYQAFFRYACAKEAPYLKGIRTEMMQAFQASFYTGGTFQMPPRPEPEDALSPLDEEDEGEGDVSFFWGDPEETAEDGAPSGADEEADEAEASLEEMFDPAALDENIRTLLEELHAYYRTEKWEKDIHRAMQLYFGPVRMQEEFSEEGGPPAEALLLFWDFFLFDYHLIASDQRPIHAFFVEKGKELPHGPREIAEKLLVSRFTLFYIESFDGVGTLCRDLFTGERMELPCPETGRSVAHKVLLFGHVHADGVMLLNYIQSVPATVALRRRIKEEIERLYAIYRIQAPGATMGQFFDRHAAAVRQLVIYMTTYARLRMVPEVAPLSYHPAGPCRLKLAAAQAQLEKALGTLGFSSYERMTVVRLYQDVAAELATEAAKNPTLLAAVTLYFAIQNVRDLGDMEAFFAAFPAKKEAVAAVLPELFIALDMLHPDPRYLTEEGFVHLLFRAPEEAAPQGTEGPHAVK